MSLFKELARKVTLVDLIEDTKEACKLIDNSDLEDKKGHKSLCKSRNWFRAGLRIHGKALGILYSTYNVLLYQENSARHIATGVAITAAAYLVDHLFNEFSPSPYKNIYKN